MAESRCVFRVQTFSTGSRRPWRAARPGPRPGPSSCLRPALARPPTDPRTTPRRHPAGVYVASRPPGAAIAVVLADRLAGRGGGLVALYGRL